MPRDLFKFCISTIVERRRLEQFALKSSANFTERRAWKTAKLLYEQSRKAGASLPVILSDAAYDSEQLLLWGVLQKLTVDGDHTTVHLTGIQRVHGSHGRQELTLRSSGKAIKPNFIRPYAISETPEFLK
jgi:hypothetical protein